jgi:hypothetical protein
MVLRAAGEVGCAHCTTMGADRACQVCTRLVCERCAADWSTCSEPSGRVVRLGTSARVRDVDPLGRIALVSHWRKPLRLFDLRALRWLPNELSRLIYLTSRAVQPRLTSDRTVVYLNVIRLNDDQLRADLRWQSFGDLPSDERSVNMPSHGTGVSAAGDHYWCVSDTQHVIVQHRAFPEERPDPEALGTILVAREKPNYQPRIVQHSYEPLPRKVVQVAYVHVADTQKLLASGSWSELALHRIVDDHLELVTRFQTSIQGDVVWLGIGGPWFIAAIRRSAGGVRFQLHLLEPNRRGIVDPGPFVREITPSAPFRTAALSRDGRHLAIATDAGLVVHDLDERTEQLFTEHTDDINYVRFASDDHVLISADCDNRLILRPRTPDGTYARPLIAIEVDAP